MRDLNVNEYLLSMIAVQLRRLRVSDNEEDVRMNVRQNLAAVEMWCQHCCGHMGVSGATAVFRSTWPNGDGKYMATFHCDRCGFSQTVDERGAVVVRMSASV